MGSANPAYASFPYGCVVILARFLVRLFFRQIEVTGRENVPPTGGGILVAWHPNGLLDPILMLTQFPRGIVFGARHGLFRWPVVGWLMRRLGAVPVYRKADASAGTDDSERRAANRKSLDALAQAVGEGAFTALFPEGLSHDEPHPVELRTGVARLFYSARRLTPSSEPAPVILPVGLHYDKKNAFRSEVLVAFHPPIKLTSELAEPPPPGASEEQRRAQYRRLVGELDRVLKQVVHATESWELNHLMQRTGKLMHAERARREGVDFHRPEMAERVLAFARVWEGYHERKRSHPEEIAKLTARIRSYDRDLRALGLEDHELDESIRSDRPWQSPLLILHALGIYFLMPPVLIYGIAVNGVAALGLCGLTKRTAKLNKDEATIKLLVGAVLFPLTWLAVGSLVGWGVSELHERFPRIPNVPFLAGFVSILIGAVGGVLAIHYRSLARGVAHSLRVRLTRARRSAAVERLRDERAALYEVLVDVSRGLHLPGTMASDGREAARTGPSTMTE